MTDDDARILSELHHAIERLADAVADQPPIAGALRRFADVLPIDERPRAPPPRDPTAIRGLLYRALDAGAIDAHRFDWLMLARQRAHRRRTRALAPTAIVPSRPDVG